MAYHVWGVALVLDTVAQYNVALVMKLQWGVLAPWVAIVLGTITSVCYIASLFARFEGKAHKLTWLMNILYCGVSALAVIIDILLYLFDKNKYYCVISPDGDASVC